MNPLEPSFAFSAHCEIHLQQYSKVALSAPVVQAQMPIDEKDLTRADDAPVVGKYTITQHLDEIARRGDIDATMPLLALGLRNNLVNLRAPIIQRGTAHAVAGEAPELSARPYYGLGCRDGRIVLDQALGRGYAASEWPEFFCAAVPVLWDSVSGPELFDLMLAEAADHSHLFELPRGKHWLASAASLAAWDRLHRVFAAHIHSGLNEVARAVRDELALITPPLRRAGGYLHAVIGSRPDGTLICIYHHGLLESVGELARSRGCTRAVCVENSGSVMPTFLPEGIEGPIIPLLRAPNFRPRGRTMLVFEMPSSRFTSKPFEPAH